MYSGLIRLNRPYWDPFDTIGLIWARVPTLQRKLIAGGGMVPPQSIYSCFLVFFNDVCDAGDSITLLPFPTIIRLGIPIHQITAQPEIQFPTYLSDNRSVLINCQHDLIYISRKARTSIRYSTLQGLPEIKFREEPAVPLELPSLCESQSMFIIYIFLF